MAGNTVIRTAALVALTSFFYCAAQSPPSDQGQCLGRPVCVEMGVPSIWSLQQAHYLLERNRALNRSLRAKPLSELDPNVANSTRIDILRSFFGLSAEFDQKKLVDNRIAFAKREEQTTKKAETEARIRQLRSRRDGLASQRAQQQAELAVLQADPNAKDQAVAKQAEIDRTTAEINIVNQQITDLGTPTVDDLNTTNTEAAAAGTTDKLGAALTQENLMKLMAPLIGKEASLAASSILDNNLSLQYEIIAKQLTLLRDEAGPNRSVIFLELPQSIYTANSKGNDYIVRTKWRIKGLFIKAPLNEAGVPEQRSPLDICAILQLSLNPPDESGFIRDHCAPSYLFKDPVRPSWTASEFQSEIAASAGLSIADKLRTIAAGLKEKALVRSQLSPYIYVSSSESLAKSVELIPSKSYLTVNDFQASVRAKNLMFILKSLLGFGLRLDYQSQREAYDTFLSQEVHASAMGKGTGTFGWVFGPEPGKKHINPGTRTTYAVLWVPSDAHGLHLTREYCYFKRDSDDVDKHCFTPENNDSFIAIPHATEGFYLEKIYYRSVDVGQTATMYLHGDDFSPQISVLVDGQALPRALSLGDPRLAAEHGLPAAPAPPAGTKFYGEYEVVNPNLIVLRITSTSDASPGSPEISLVAPNKALAINELTLKINGRRDLKLADSEAMFRGAFHLTDFKFDSRSTKIKALLLGGPFDKDDIIKLNGKKLEVPEQISPTHRIIEFDRPDDYNWSIFVTSHSGKRPITEVLSMTDPLAPDRVPGSITPVAVPNGDNKSMRFTIKGAHFYASKPPDVKGAESCSAADKDWADVAADSKVSDDGKSAEILIVNPPKCVQVNYKTHANDTHKSWPITVTRTWEAEKPKKKTVDDSTN